MPTVNLDPQTYKILKKISRAMGVPMSTIVRIAVLKQVRKWADEGIPPEIELEMYYNELLQMYNLIRMAERIQHWFENRLEKLKAKADTSDYEPVRQLLKKYVSRMDEIYRKLEESFKEKKSKTLDKKRNELIEMEEIQEVEIIDEMAKE